MEMFVYVWCVFDALRVLPISVLFVLLLILCVCFCVVHRYLMHTLVRIPIIGKIVLRTQLEAKHVSLGLICYYA
jgi:hypothetical protein